MARGTPQVPRSVDAVVVGGGHAGIEAAWALSRLGHRTALVTFDAGAIGRMSCNPAIGGLAKGQLVREIDALGGLMGRLIDQAGIHFRMLNRSKGAAVHAPRAQADKQAYCRLACRALAAIETLDLIEGEVTELITEGVNPARVVGVRISPPEWGLVQPGGAHSRAAGRPPGVRAEAGVVRVSGCEEISAPVVILTVGTFLKGKVYTGLDPRPGGRRGEPPARGIVSSLEHLGLRVGRLKTGTPPRLRRDSIDFDRLQPQPGEEPPPRFSFYEEARPCNQVQCHLTRTQPETHKIIRSAMDRSPLYGGMIDGVGPRYCPSIEDKVVRFPQRLSHQVFLEPEGIASDRIYPNGISTSLPEDVQREYVRSIPGLERAEIVHPGYAVEYDFLLTNQIDTALAVNGVKGLFSAGQINGTSGYEEAAAQGLMAGVNADAYLTERQSRTLARDEAYIGVLLDDLVTKVPTEPYRMFTSQSEYRLLLRQDNADRRLAHLGCAWGLLSAEDLERTRARWEKITRDRQRLRGMRLDREAWARAADFSERDLGRTFEELLRRPRIDLDRLEGLGFEGEAPGDDRVTIEAEVKYEGYVEKQQREVARTRGLERRRIPDKMLDAPPGALSAEARQRLREHRPETLGQALRVPGITPSDVFLLAVLIRAKGGGRERQQSSK